MSCIKVSLTRKDAVSCTAKRVGDRIIPEAFRVGRIAVFASREGDVTVNARWQGGIRCRAYLECPTGIQGPYLEIAPEIVWVLAGWTSNDVYSNVNWNID